jgi:hypothetical protein
VSRRRLFAALAVSSPSSSNTVLRAQVSAQNAEIKAQQTFAAALRSDRLAHVFESEIHRQEMSTLKQTYDEDIEYAARQVALTTARHDADRQRWEQEQNETVVTLKQQLTSGLQKAVQKVNLLKSKNMELQQQLDQVHEQQQHQQRREEQSEDESHD